MGDKGRRSRTMDSCRRDVERARMLTCFITGITGVAGIGGPVWKRKEAKRQADKDGGMVSTWQAVVQELGGQSFTRTRRGKIWSPRQASKLQHRSLHLDQFSPRVFCFQGRGDAQGLIDSVVYPRYDTKVPYGVLKGSGY